MTTIKDIADRLGISLSTVSKGLNGANDISEELRQLVLDTAVEMGYQTKKMKKEEFKKLCLFIKNMDTNLRRISAMTLFWVLNNPLSGTIGTSM